VTSGEAHIFRVFSTDVVTPGELVAVHPDDLRHVTVVLRGARSGLEVVDQDGAIYAARVDGKQIVAEEILQGPASQPSIIHLYVGGSSGSAWDATLDQSTQAGVTTITFMASSSSELKRSKARLDRSERVARSAARQAKRRFLPALKQPLLWDQLEVSADKLRFVLVPGAQLSMIDAIAAARRRDTGTSSEIHIVVGSSDGIPSPVERRLVDRGWVPARLGDTVMRTELAAAHAVGIARMMLTDGTSGQ
jgi:16S rRNA (uracil1498-N3)-methyltransferase